MQFIFFLQNVLEQIFSIKKYNIVSNSNFPLFFSLTFEKKKTFLFQNLLLRLFIKNPHL